MTGTVIDFDDEVGLGRIGPRDGGPSLRFHCVSIADGTRTVPAGASVIYRLGAGVGGRWEAIDVVAVDR